MASGWTRHDIGGAWLEVREWGAGEPLVVVQTALTADELVPVAASTQLDGWRRIAYHRRGYVDSDPAHPAGSIRADSADCAALLDVLDVEGAHVVGASYAGAVAMELAATQFRAVAHELMAVRRTHGTDAALERFMSGLVGPDWWARAGRS